MGSLIRGPRSRVRHTVGASSQALESVQSIAALLQLWSENPEPGTGGHRWTQTIQLKFVSKLSWSRPHILAACQMTCTAHTRKLSEPGMDAGVFAAVRVLFTNIKHSNAAGIVRRMLTNLQGGPDVKAGSGSPGSGEQDRLH